jgi:AcrR family transcriptional regulator
MPTSFARPKRADAIAIARRAFVQGERVDMQPVAEALGIGRTTLYRWVGDREQLLGEVLAQLTDETFAIVIEQADGEGTAWALDVFRRFMELTSSFPPLVRFAEREPHLALRVLLSSSGSVSGHLALGIGAVLEHPRAAVIDEAGGHGELVDTLVQIGTALEWAPIVIGQPPEIERGIRLMAAAIDGVGASGRA